MTTTNQLAPATPAPGSAGARVWWRTPVAVFGLPALAALAVLMIGVWSPRQLWRDEHATWWAARLPLGELAGLVRHVDLVLAPYYLVMHAWIAAAGDSEVALRLPSALLMAAAAGLLALLGRRLFDAPTGLLAGALFAALPTVSRYGQDARPYAAVMAATLLATLALLHAVDRPSSWWRWLGYAASVLAVASLHLVAVLVLAAHAVVVLRGGRSALLWKWPAAVAVGLAPIVPLALRARAQSTQISWIRAGAHEVLGMPGMLFGSTRVAWAVLALAVIGLAARRWQSVFLGVWALLPPALTYVTFSEFHFFYHRYLLFTVPAWALLAASATRFWAGRRRLVIGAALVVVVAALGVPDQRAVRSDAVENELAFRAAARHVAAHAQPGDAIAYGGYRYLRRAMAYEFRAGGAPRDVFLQVTPEARGRFAGRDCDQPAACALGVRRIWLLTSERGDLLTGIPTGQADVLRQGFTVTSTTDFPRLRVALLEIRR
jgi:mannosyltransferase